MLDVLDNPDPEYFYREYVRKRRPAVIKNLTTQWPAMQWTPDWLSKQFAGLELQYETWDGDEHVNDPLDFQEKRTCFDSTMAEFVGLMRQSDVPSRKYYCAGFKMLEALPHLRGSFGNLESFMGWPSPVPAAVRKMLTISPFMWMGPAGTLSTLHFDRFDNFFVQLHGSKKWIHAEPQYGEHFYYPHARMETSWMHFSPVDLENLDHERFPLAREVPLVETIVEEGDVMYTPAGWWHFVRALTESVAMNFFWFHPVQTTASVWKYGLLTGRRKLLERLGMQKLIASMEATA